ncbi:hypothetical protein ACGVWS_05305 [Enterobacteriaceae bacterium LUAb1]
MGKYQKGHEKKKLYRTVNTATHDVNHFYGGEYRWERKKQKLINEERPFFQSMGGRKRRGIDYTPLFMFLLNKVGEKWDLVYSEAIKRLDKPDPIFWLVALRFEDKRDVVRCGESSYYNGLYVDGDGILKKVSAALTSTDIPILCNCCTYTFNGVRINHG